MKLEGETSRFGGFEQLNHISTRFKVNPNYRLVGGHSISPVVWGWYSISPVVVVAATTPVYWGGGIKLVPKIKAFQKFRLRLI